MNWLMELLGRVKCRICYKWTEPSIIFGDICSLECCNKEK